jgi:hypothetical protein
MDAKVTALQVEAIRALSIEDRLRVAESLRKFAWDLKASVIAQRNPGLSEAEVAALVREAFGGAGA